MALVFVFSGFDDTEFTYVNSVNVGISFGVHVCDRGELGFFSNGKNLKEVVIENEEVEELVKNFELYTLLKCSYEMIDKGIIYAFVERWHRDTNSFHLPIGEMTITLDDVSSLLHIPITSAFFSVNIFNMDDVAELLAELLGVNQAAAYADDESAFVVSVAYLECFRYLNSFGGYAWGVVALAYLYDNLREASMHQTRTVSGYLTLLQEYPRALRWKPKRDKDLVLPFRKALDEIDVDDICWTPYIEHRSKRPFEVVSLFRWWIRCGPKMYAHLPDRVLRQYGHVQTILGSPLEIVGQTTTPEEMDVMFTQYVVHVVDDGAIVHEHVDCANKYMVWFRRISHPYIIRREPVHVAHSVAEPADDDHAPAPVKTMSRAIQIAEELLGQQLVLPDGMTLVNELILVLRSQMSGGIDWINVVPYRRRHRGT
uniref:Protein MAIN-LIKE 1-like n=1 Tax=Cicer arietinum TaxID=3827 RepID=A0A1S2YW85_CICAR|nr:protein MAIN-LIKE 1-like [Cicer arietinum]